MQPAGQDDIARVVLRLAGTDDAPPAVLLPDERAARANSNAATAGGEFTTGKQARDVWAKHGW